MENLTTITAPEIKKTKAYPITLEFHCAKCECEISRTKWNDFWECAYQTKCEGTRWCDECVNDARHPDDDMDDGFQCPCCAGLTPPAKMTTIPKRTIKARVPIEDHTAVRQKMRKYQ